MGGDKTTTQSSTQTTASPEERELLKNQLSIQQAGTGDQIALNKQASSLALNLLQGQNLPGYLNTLPGGISPDVTDSIVKQSLQDIQPQFQKGGILDSGVNAQISARTAADIRNQSAQFNLQNLMQLLNLASGSSAQVQQPMNANAALAGNSLQGLRSTSTSGSTIGMNPFLKTFQQSLGQSFGEKIGNGAGQGTGGLFAKLGGG